jgi:hypothetical protein
LVKTGIFPPTSSDALVKLNRNAPSRCKRNMRAVYRLVSKGEPLL